MRWRQFRTTVAELRFLIISMFCVCNFYFAYFCISGCFGADVCSIVSLGAELSTSLNDVIVECPMAKCVRSACLPVFVSANQSAGTWCLNQ